MDVLDDLAQVLARLAGTDPFALADPASVVTLERAQFRLACVLANALAGFCAGGEWAGDGAKSAAAWVATTCHLPRARCTPSCAGARPSPRCPWWRRRFARVPSPRPMSTCWSKRPRRPARVTPRPSHVVKRRWCRRPQSCSFVPFANTVTYFTQMADPDGAEEADLARRARRDAYVVESMQGMYLVGGNLDPISGAIVAGELRRLEDQLFRGRVGGGQRGPRA